MRRKNEKRKAAVEVQKAIYEKKPAACLILIDIDYFIRYCMKLRKGQCRRILSNIYVFLQREFSEGQVWHQQGTDEFYILMENCHNDRGREKTEEVLHKFRKERFASFAGTQYRNVRITFSAGVASWPENGDQDIILRKATTALFAAKSFRRNQVVDYSEELVMNPKRILYQKDLKVEQVAGMWGVAGRVFKGTDLSEACFGEPQGIAVSVDNKLFLADQNNHQILRMDDKKAEPAAGSGYFGKTRHGAQAARGRFNKPTGLCVREESVFIADTGNDMVIRLDRRTGRLYVICGKGTPGYAGDGGPARKALLNKPGSVDFDRVGNLYINDIANNVIRKIDKKGIITTFAGNGKFGFEGDGGPALHASFHEIYGLCLDSKRENLYIADYWNHRIRRIHLSDSMIDTAAGNGRPQYTGDGGNPLQAGLHCPVAVCVDKEDNIYVAESGNQSIRIIHKKKNKIFTLAGGCGLGTGLGEGVETYRFANPNSLAVKGQILYVLDGGNNRVCKINLKEALK